MVEPIHPFERGEFHRLDVSPWSTPTDHLGLEQADDGLGEGIVVGVADAAGGGLDACCGQAFSIADRDVRGGFKWSSQHDVRWLTEATYQTPRQVFSTQASFGGGR